MLGGNIPTLWCPVLFGHILVLIWKSFLEILKTSAPLIRVGNVCITESVKLLRYNKIRRHFDAENQMASTLYEVGALPSIREAKRRKTKWEMLPAVRCGQAFRSELCAVSPRGSTLRERRSQVMPSNTVQVENLQASKL